MDTPTHLFCTAIAQCSTLYWRALFMLIVIPLLLMSANGQEPITRISEVRSLSPAEAAKALPVQLRGVVTWKNLNDFVIQDDSGGIYTYVGLAISRKIWQGENDTLAKLRAGMVVELRGITDQGKFAPQILPSSINILGEAPLPTAKEMIPARFFSGAEYGHRITARGVLLCAYPYGENSYALIIDAMPGIFVATIPTSELPDHKQLIDAELRLTGVSLSRFNTRGEFIMPRLRMNGRDCTTTIILTP
jgi:hypothetical protein